VLLPAMKEVGDKFGAGELILPFVLQSAEVMKRAVARLENYLEKKEGRRRARSCWPRCSATCTTSASRWSTRS
jgi:5-methyltetrahydrofolate--homocysteine methyltransferase